MFPKVSIVNVTGVTDALQRRPIEVRSLTCLREEGRRFESGHWSEMAGVSLSWQSFPQLRPGPDSSTRWREKGKPEHTARLGTGSVLG